MRTSTAFTIALGLSLSALACSGSPTDPSRSGNLRLMITDAPLDDASALHVTFTEVKAHREDGAGGGSRCRSRAVRPRRRAHAT